MRTSKKTTSRSCSLPNEWLAEIDAYIKKNEVDVMCFNDYIKRCVAEDLNRRERARGLQGTHHYTPSDVLRGRPRKPKQEPSHVSSNSNEEAKVVEANAVA